MLKKRLNRTSERSVEAIEYGLLELLESRPLSAIKISELCFKAGISRPTFYAHFKDKDDVLAWHIARQLEPIASALFRLSEPDVAKADQVILTFFKTWEALDKAFQLYRENDVLPLVRAHYLTLQREMYLRDPWLKNSIQDEDPEVIFAYFTGALFSVLELWMSQSNRVDAKQLANSILKLLPMGR